MALLANGSIKCDECGRFIALDSILLGTAFHQFILPDSEHSVETYESLCSDCLHNKKVSLFAL